MMRPTVLAVALAAAFGASLPAHAATDAELAQIRDEIKQMKQSYEARIQALEQQLRQVQTAAAGNAASALPAAPAAPASAQPNATAPSEPAEAAAPQASAAPAAANAFNPAISLILGGTYANLSQDPNAYRLQGFMAGGDDTGPGKRSFALGESELTFSANVDPDFAGRLTFSVLPDNTVSVEEAAIQTLGLSNGLNLQAGRFLSGIGYLNSQHAHAWDFVDAPLAYQAFLGGQYKQDGVQLRWLAPIDRYLEFGAELGSGGAFPGTDRNRNGAGSQALFAHMGDDIGDSASWRAGVSYLNNHAADRSIDAQGPLFSGDSGTWIADGIYKWAPNGDPTRRNFKLQGEYFRQRQDGMLSSANGVGGSYAGTQTGWYLQGVYQFMPLWRAGLRYDRLHSGTPEIGQPLAIADVPSLSPYDPARSTLMVDYSPSEFSRLRVQFARDRSRPDATDNQFFLQYIMSLGTHAAHTF